MIITIDGPVATGKSTVAKRVAERLHFVYFDTGAMYRCFTLYLIRHAVSLTDQAALKKALEEFAFDIKLIDGEKHYFVDGQDVTKEIRSVEVTNLVADVAAIGSVRERLVKWQRSYAQAVDAVFEGRDLGSHVFPQAELKIFLTGRDEVRAMRRFKEYQARYPKEKVTLEKVLKDLEERDRIDSTREHSPLKPAPDAKFVDTSDLSIEEVVNSIITLYEEVAL